MIIIGNPNLTVDAVLINKMDLLPYLKFDVERFTKAVFGMNEKADIIQTSCTTGQGIREWTLWLLARMGRV